MEFKLCGWLCVIPGAKTSLEFRAIVGLMPVGYGFAASEVGFGIKLFGLVLHFSSGAAFPL